MSPENLSHEFYQGSERRVIGPECVPEPADVFPFDGNDVETHDGIRKPTFARDKQRGRAHDLALFPVVDSVGRCRKCAGAPASNFDKRKALSVQHDQVDLAAATAEIARHRA